MKFIANTNTNTEVAPNAAPLIASISANHPIAKVTTHAAPLIASPPISHPIAEEASHVAVPLIHRHPPTAAAEPATGSAAASSATSGTPSC